VFFLIKKYLKKIQSEFSIHIFRFADRLLDYFEKLLFGETFHDLEKQKYLLIEKNKLLKDENDYLTAALYFARKGGR